MALKPRYWIIMASLLLVSGCSDYAALPSHTEDSGSLLTSCADTGADAFAAWQCHRFYARQKINGYCMTVPGGEMGIRQCQQFYSKLAEQPAPVSAPSVTRPTSSPPPSAPAAVAVGKFAGRERIYVGGAIVSDENEEFVRRAAEARNPLVVLSGPGGNTLAAIRIGQLVRMHGWDTPSTPRANPACLPARWRGWEALIATWERLPRLGFTRAIAWREARQSESGVGNAVVSALPQQPWVAGARRRLCNNEWTG